MLIARVSARHSRFVVAFQAFYTCMRFNDSPNCLLTCFSAELSCFYFTAWLDDHYIRQLPDPDELTRELLDSSDAALSFKEGDILQVLNMDDPNWWQVRARITWSLRSASVMLCWGCFRRRRWTRTGLAV